jgi:hypothetical protein
MALFRMIFSFAAGTGVGIYLAQNYDLPSVQSAVDTAVVFGKRMDEMYRKHNDKPKDS